MAGQFARVAIVAGTMAAGLAAAQPAAAQDRVSILLGSYHVNSSFNFEEFNPGAFLTWEGERFDWSVGGFRNSYGGGSVAAMVGYPVYDWDWGQIALTGGLALYPGEGDRFKYNAGDVIPLAGMRATVGNAFVQAFPSDSKTTDAIISFGLTFGLDANAP